MYESFSPGKRFRDAPVGAFATTEVVNENGFRRGGNWRLFM
jgi:hypothetical protein